MSTNNSKAILTSIYTLTPTHCGTGQASGAVDLPIAREAHTALPILPATTLKGVVRDWDCFHLPADRSKWSDNQKELYVEIIKPLFGPLPRIRKMNLTDSENEQNNSTPGSAGIAEDDPNAGELIFLDALLLAFPVRSLTGTFRFITSPLQIQRALRLMKAFKINPPSGFIKCQPVDNDDELYIPQGKTGPVNLEDIVFERYNCSSESWVTSLAKSLAGLISSDMESQDSIEFMKRLVVVSDSLFKDLTIRATPVTARIVLKRNEKTADNLWYEECLPPDCLFAAFVASRPGVLNNPIDIFTQNLGKISSIYTQIGGNITVGQGQCRWNIKPGDLL
ncbi:type III-B CRISPR module RAMP protein Cmr4 [bacterium]|nr:type III-B CRISPR module RAMP protein Cmr4 [bacterium]